MLLSEKYGYRPDVDQIGSSLEIIAANMDSAMSPEALKNCFSLMDLTTLHPQDTVSSVEKLVGKVNALSEKYPSYPLPASICAFSNFASTIVRSRRTPELHATVVSGCFPDSQSFLEVKVKECEMAVRSGADEIDIVLALNHFLEGDYKAAGDEIVAMRQAIDREAALQGRKVILKVILETGVLSTPEKIADASFLAMESGADFIKTSTGKVSVNATPMAAFVMCQCILKYYQTTGRKVGFKAAGGISTAKDAFSYYMIVSSVLSEEWLCRDLFRFGVSRLGNSLMSEIEQTSVAYF